MYRSERIGFSLVDLLVVLVISCVLIGLVLPVVQQARETSRRVQCTNNLSRLASALYAYHDTYQAFPFREGGLGRHQHNGGPVAPYQRQSGYVLLLPFIDQHSLSDEIASAGSNKMPWEAWQPWNETIDLLLCPSSPEHYQEDQIGNANYVFCAGDSADTEALEPRGIFGLVHHTRLADITDGATNTLALSERVFPTSLRDRANVNYGSDPATPADCSLTFDLIEGYSMPRSATGNRWTDGGSAYLAMNTCLPPNSPQCAYANHEAQDGFYTASSDHPGGAMAMFADGSIRFISEAIEAGNQGATSVADGPSPFGVWGSMGSKNGDEYTPGSECR
ncbi:DUF1559 domain-containing protein [bacterium]|nr:DUF1559 domain-containing protein [bacterium]